MEEETPELDSEIRRLEAALRRQKAYYKDDIRYLNTSVNKLSAMLDNIYNNLLSFLKTLPLPGNSNVPRQ